MKLSCLLVPLAFCYMSAFAQQGVRGAPVLLVVLASPAERQQLEKDIATLEGQDWDFKSLEQELNRWASQRNLILQKDQETGFYLAVSQRLVKSSFYGGRLAVAQQLRSSLDQSRAIVLHEQPAPLRTMLEQLTMQGETYPMAFFKITEALPAPKFLMPGALVYAEVPVNEEQTVQVNTEILFSNPNSWGGMSEYLQNLPQQKQSSEQNAPEPMMVLYSKFAPLRIDMLQKALEKLIALWTTLQEQMREQYAKEIESLRIELKRMAEEQTGLPMDTPLDWNILPQEMKQRIIDTLRMSGLDVSEASLADKSVKFSISLRLHTARVYPDAIMVYSTPFGEDYGAIHARRYPRSGN